MVIEYKGKRYELVELHELNKEESYDVCAIFEMELSSFNVINGEFDHDGDIYDFKTFINFFYGATTSTLEKNIEIAKDYINEYLQKEIKDTLTQLENMLSLEGQDDESQDMLNDEIGGRCDYLHSLLKSNFKDEIEEEKFYDLFFSFKSWDDFKDFVIEISKRG